MAKFHGDSPRPTGIQGPASLEGYQGLHLQSAAVLHLVQRLTFCSVLQRDPMTPGDAFVMITLVGRK